MNLLALLLANPVKTILSVALIAALCWGWRVDSLRAGYKVERDDMHAALRVAGFKPSSAARGASAIAWLAKDRERAWRNRDELTTALSDQSDQVAKWKAQADAAQLVAQQARAQADATAAERDKWIALAEAAAKPRAAGTCETEAREARDALDAVRHSGF